MPKTFIILNQSRKQGGCTSQKYYKALELNPKNMVALIILGNILSETGNFDKALLDHSDFRGRIISDSHLSGTRNSKDRVDT
jgi:inorganic pyrophosphatase/exopolyphosphatase